MLPTSVGSAETLDLTLDQAVQMALEMNLSIQAAHLNARARMAGVTEEEARFGRSLLTRLNHSVDRSPSVFGSSGPQAGTNRVQDLGLEVSQQMATGGRLGVALSQSRSWASSAAGSVYGSSLDITFTQPLLRGRGKVNRASLDIATNSLERAEIDLEGSTRNLTAQVRSAYWDLFLAQKNLEVAQQLSDGGRRVVETVRARVEMGAEARNSVLQAEVGVAGREENIVITEARVHDAEDRLKSLLGLDRDPEAWDVSLIPHEQPGLSPFAGSVEQGLDGALALNTAFRQKEIDLRNTDLHISVARDDTRPAVDLTLRAGLGGLGSRFSDDWRGIGDADGRSWQGGVSLSVPVGASAARARLQGRLIEKEQAETEHERLRLALARDVRERHRDVNTAHRRAEVTLLAERLAEQNVSEEEERLLLGLSTVRQVLDAQDDLAESRARRLQAVVDYNKALIEWERMTGQRST